MVRACGTVCWIQPHQKHVAELMKLPVEDRTLACSEFQPSCTDCRRAEAACPKHDTVKLRAEWATSLLRECRCIVGEAENTYIELRHKIAHLKERLEKETQRSDSVHLNVSGSTLDFPELQSSSSFQSKAEKAIEAELRKKYQLCKDTAFQLYKTATIYDNLAARIVGYNQYGKHAQTTRHQAGKLLRLAEWNTVQDPDFSRAMQEARRTRRRHCSCLGHCVNKKKHIGSIKQAVRHANGLQCGAC